ncbi:hypothetical protein ABW21_db0202904 [Orbilia brochopaga]|nr:hypothetical protein ABW21_db0202904 [Drechslerella brochopaga]
MFPQPYYEEPPYEENALQGSFGQIIPLPRPMAPVYQQYMPQAPPQYGVLPQNPAIRFGPPPTAQFGPPPTTQYHPSTAVQFGRPPQRINPIFGIPQFDGGCDGAYDGQYESEYGPGVIDLAVLDPWPISESDEDEPQSAMQPIQQVLGLGAPSTATQPVQQPIQQIPLTPVQHVQALRRTVLRRQGSQQAAPSLPTITEPPKPVGTQPQYHENFQQMVEARGDTYKPYEGYNGAARDVRFSNESYRDDWRPSNDRWWKWLCGCCT